ncbi:MAG: DUF2318 domain-containing protein [Nanoarchaeota archaeon]|nr:DUF2318 domain-containing protein [Nanoarchaeota archaeon]
MRTEVIIGTVVFLVAVLVLANPFGSNLTGAAVSTGEVKIPLSGITSQAKWYEYDASGTKVRFFAVRANDGSVKTGFDACDVCYTSRKGYRQEGNYMVCNNCGNKYLINGLGTENKKPGGCWPGYLPNTVIGDTLVIENSDLEGGKARFI